MEFTEFTAKTVEDCITDACTSLCVPSDKLEYEIVSEGSSGFMGIGSKPAVIKARVKSEESEAVAVTETVKENESVKEEVKTEKVETVKDNTDKEIKSETKHTKPVKNISAEQIEEMKKEAVKFLTDVFKAMDIEANIVCDYDVEDYTLSVTIDGGDMGVLIGRRGQTLDSLQYLVSLVVNKGTAEYVRVKVDTENYRERRKATLENLAKNMAFKVKRTKRAVSLEPMNPYERRIIHSALQNDKYVTTHSEGEEPYRKVVITLKKN